MPEILTKAQSRVYDNTGGMEPPEKMREIIDALREAGFIEEIEQKSNIISDNVKGIVQIHVNNATLYDRFGIRCNVRDRLCDSKLRVVKSREGYGMDKLEAILKALKSEMNMMPGPQPGMLDAALTPVRKNP